MGIVNGENFQIVYSDTPGLIKNPAYKLQEAMMNFVEGAFIDADIFLLIIDVTNDEDFDEKVIEKIKQSGAKVIIPINKIDLTDQATAYEHIDKWKAIFPDAPIIPVSAAHKFNLEAIIDEIIELLPEGEPFFPKDDLTDKPTRFFVSEIIREKILLNYKQEIPYSCEVYVDSYTETPKIDKIRAIIYVSRESQKAILIGKGGSALKRLGIESRKDIEEFVGKQVYLELFVKVMKDWRDDDMKLKQLGYE